MRQCGSECSVATDQSEAPSFADSHYEQSKHCRYYLIDNKSPVAFRANGALKSFLWIRLTRSYERLTYARPFPCSIELDRARRFRRELALRPG